MVRALLFGLISAVCVYFFGSVAVDTAARQTPSSYVAMGDRG